MAAPLPTPGGRHRPIVRGGMANNRRRTPEQNRQAYLRRKEKALLEGYSGYGQKRRVVATVDPDAYYRKLISGKGDIASTWRQVAARTEGLEVDDADIAIAYAKVARKARYERNIRKREKLFTEFVESLGLASHEAQWLLFQLNGSP